MRRWFAVRRAQLVVPGRRGSVRPPAAGRWLASMAVAAMLAGCGGAAQLGPAGVGAGVAAGRPAPPVRGAVALAAGIRHRAAGGPPVSRTAAGVQPTAGPRLRIPVVMYHVIAPPPRSPYAYLYVSVQRFARQMAALRAAGYCAVSLHTAAALWRGSGVRPPRCRPLVVRFDDGYASVFQRAFPVLRRMGWPANLCQQVQRIDFPGGLTAGQIRGLLAHGWGLADHGYYQPELSLIGASPAQMRRQLADSRRMLAARFAVPVHFYCWPLGYYDRRAVRAARAAGFQGGLGVGLGAAEPAVQGRWRLDAIPVWGSLSTRGLVAEVRRLQAHPSPVPPAAYRP